MRCLPPLLLQGQGRSRKERKKEAGAGGHPAQGELGLDGKGDESRKERAKNRTITGKKGQ